MHSKNKNSIKKKQAKKTKNSSQLARVYEFKLIENKDGWIGLFAFSENMADNLTPKTLSMS